MRAAQRGGQHQHQDADPIDGTPKQEAAL